MNMLMAMDSSQRDESKLLLHISDSELKYGRFSVHKVHNINVAF